MTLRTLDESMDLALAEALENAPADGAGVGPAALFLLACGARGAFGERVRHWIKAARPSDDEVARFAEETARRITDIAANVKAEEGCDAG